MFMNLSAVLGELFFVVLCNIFIVFCVFCAQYYAFYEGSLIMGTAPGIMLARNSFWRDKIRFFFFMVVNTFLLVCGAL